MRSKKVKRLTKDEKQILEDFESGQFQPIPNEKEEMERYRSYFKEMPRKKVIIDPDLEERKKDGYYWQHAFCSNCDRPDRISYGSVDVMIVLGMKKPTHKFTCPNCKCKTLSL